MRHSLLVFVLTVATALATVGDTQAQRRGFGGRGFGGGYGGRGFGGGYGWGGYGGYGGWGSGYGWGGYGGYSRPYYSGYGYSPYYSGYSGYSPYYSGYSYSPYYSGYSYSPYSYSYAPVASHPADDGGYVNQSSNPTVNQASTSGTVLVRVPVADAQVWFDGHLTQQKGMERWFHTPALQAGQNSSYTIRARWMQNGQPVERERRVTVEPGQQAAVDFRNEV